MIPFIVLTITRLATNRVIGMSNFMSILSRSQIIVIFWALVAEELGWPGFLQEKIEMCTNKKHIEQCPISQDDCNDISNNE